MRILLVFLLLNFIFMAGFSLDPPDIVHFEDLTFNSDFEEKAFGDLHTGKENMLKLLTAIDPDVNDTIFYSFVQELNGELNRLRTRRFNRRKVEKKIEYLYTYVNTQVLSLYQEKILFPHLFVNGKFNCLTASAYYGFFLDSLGIDYFFKETYNHVHPVAFAEGKEVKIETTDRLAGVEYYNAELKSEFVDYLLSSRTISREEYNSNSAEDLFHRYFLPAHSVGMKELAGLHYMNDALYRFDAGDLAYAFEQIKKAYYIYPSEKMLAIFRFLHSNMLVATPVTRAEDAMMLVYLSRFPEDETLVAEVESGFAILSETMLFIEPGVRLYDDLFLFMDTKMEEGSLKSKLSFQYYFNRGKLYMANYQFEEALGVFRKAYDFNPVHVELQSLIISSITTIFNSSSTGNFSEVLENYSDEMPLLSTNGKFISLLMMAYLRNSEQSFDFEHEEEGLKYLHRFEELLIRNPDQTFDDERIGNAYSAAAVYYFKKYENERALEFLRRGLEIDPENYELRYRLRSVTGD